MLKAEKYHNRHGVEKTMQTRSTVMANNVAVATSHQLASFNGASIVKQGGNLFDALITTSAVLAVVQNNLCGIGGDLFALVRGPDGMVRDINGSGRSSVNATIDYFESKNITSIPARGPLSALTVPGMVDAWREIHSAYCSMELPELLRPAIELARNGVYLTRKYVESIRVTSGAMAGQPGWNSLFLPDGAIPVEGELFRQKLLAETLQAISDEGPETFYSGSLMEKILKGSEEAGCLFDESDFTKHRSTWDNPLKSNYGGTDVYETYPNSQGATVTVWLNMLGLSDGGTLSGSEKESLPLLLKTGLRAYLARSMYITDPAFQDLPPDFSSIGFAEDLLDEDLSHWSSPAGTYDRGDTTYFCLADRDGNSASVIQSNYMGFGSGVSPEGTGFVLQNRGSYFTLDRKHHNRLEPAKRTFHTLLASMGIRDGETEFVAGTMGGDIQPQVNIQIISGLIDRKMDVQDVIDRPRWAYHASIYERPEVLIAESPLYGALHGVDTSGLKLEEVPEMTSRTGHAQAIVLGRNGGIFAAADPRGDGQAAGF